MADGPATTSGRWNHSQVATMRELAVVALASVAVVVGVAVESSAQAGIQFGRITEAATGRPITGASITLDNGAGAVREEVTAGGGIYTIIGLSAGQWTLIVEAAGHETHTETIVVRNGRNPPVNAALSVLSIDPPDSQWTLLRMESGELTAGIVGTGTGDGMTVAVMCVRNAEAVMIMLPASFVFENGTAHGVWYSGEEGVAVTQHEFQVEGNTLVAGHVGSPHFQDFVDNLRRHDSVWIAVTRFGGMLTPREISLAGSTRAIDALNCN